MGSKQINKLGMHLSAHYQVVSYPATGHDCTIFSDCRNELKLGDLLAIYIRQRIPKFQLHLRQASKLRLKAVSDDSLSKFFTQNNSVVLKNRIHFDPILQDIVQNMMASSSLFQVMLQSQETQAEEGMEYCTGVDELLADAIQSL
jgi:hypothetical protein